MLAAPEPVTRDQRKENGVACGHSGCHVDDRRTGPDGWPIRETVQRHKSAFRLGDWVKSRTPSEGSLAAIGRDRTIHEARVGWCNRRIIKTEPLHNAGGEVLDDDIRARDQFPGDLSGFRHCKVERKAALVAIQAEIGGALSSDLRVLISPRIVTAVRILNLDDFRAEI